MNTKENTKTAIAPKTAPKTSIAKTTTATKNQIDIMDIDYSKKLWKNKLDSGFSNAALNHIGPQVCEFHTIITWLTKNNKTLINQKGIKIKLTYFKERNGKFFVMYKNIFLEMLDKLANGVTVEEINKEYSLEGTQLISFLSWLKEKGYTVK